jgi:hypothetical protein
LLTAAEEAPAAGAGVMPSMPLSVAAGVSVVAAESFLQEAKPSPSKRAKVRMRKVMDLIFVKGKDILRLKIFVSLPL